MDLPSALGRVDRELVLCGNLDPAAVFCQGSTDLVTRQVVELLDSTVSRRNFVISSGCDLPPQVPLENLDAFYAAASSY